MNSYIFVCIVTLTLLTNIILAFIRRKGFTFSIYAADPNIWNWLVIATTLTGTIVGGGMFLAVGQIGYEAGTVGFVLGIIYLVGLAIVGVFTKNIREMMDKGKHVTLIDLLKKTYSDSVVMQFCIVNLFMYIFLLAGQFVAVFQFAQFTQTATGNIWIPLSLVSIALISIFLYPILGGLRKDIQTDIIQALIVLTASGLVLVKLISSGVLKSLWTELPASHLTGSGYGVVFVLGAILFLTPSFLVRMDIWQRIRTAKTEGDSTRGFWIAGITSCFFYFFFTTIGMWAYVTKLPNSKVVTLDLINQQFQSPWVLGIIMGAFFAAVLSSADTFINNTSLFATKIVFPSLWNQKSQKSSDRSLLIRSRVFAVIFIIVSIVLGYFVPNFVDLLVGAFSLLLIYLPTVLGLFVENWRNPRAALWSSNTGVLLFVALFFGWNPKLAFAPAVIISIIVFVSIQVTTKRN